MVRAAASRSRRGGGTFIQQTLKAANLLFSARMSDGKFDSHRRLCPDGACIGVIGDDGRCRVCGRSATGGGGDAPPAGFLAAGSDDAPDDDAGAGADEGDADEVRDGDADAKSAAAPGAGFDPARRLCPDGGCIGVIGADGVCTVCGQKAD